MIASTSRERDFISRKYLDGGLIRAKINDAWVMGYAEINGGGAGVLFRSATDLGRDVEIRWTSFDVESISFTPMLMELDGRAVYVARAAIQSTQRSLRVTDLEAISIVHDFIGRNLSLTDYKAENVSIYELLETALYRLRGWELHTVAACLASPISVPIMQGLTRLKDETSAEVVLNRDFALTRSLSDHPAPWLWYHHLPVGKIEGGIIRVGHPGLHQEVVDYLKRSHQDHIWELHAG